LSHRTWSVFVLFSYGCEIYPSSYNIKTTNFCKIRERERKEGKGRWKGGDEKGWGEERGGGGGICGLLIIEMMSDILDVVLGDRVHV